MCCAQKKSLIERVIFSVFFGLTNPLYQSTVLQAVRLQIEVSTFDSCGGPHSPTLDTKTP